MTDDKTSPSTSALNVRPGVDIDRTRVVRPSHRRRALTVEDYVEGVAGGNRTILGRAFTLVESANAAHKEKALKVLQALAPRTGQSIRLGITGIPGVGKSTFIEALGMHLVERGHRVAVLAVDPSSGVSGGSILGDKTRMEHLTKHPAALVRPTPCGTWLGGVARGTRESILLCEAAGFDAVLVETVGVGQSETQVATMTDFFLLLMVAGAGDELQGLKRGIMEMADAIAINKADGENVRAASVARAQFEGALHLVAPKPEGWTPRAVTCSAVTHDGIAEIWAMVREHRAMLEATGQLAEKRHRQDLLCFQRNIEALLLDRFHREPRIKAAIERARIQIEEGSETPFGAAERIVHEAWNAEEPAPQVAEANQKNHSREENA